MTRSRIDEFIKNQENIGIVTRESIEGVQLKKLNLLLEREKQRGGFYAALPERLERLEDLKTLPFTTDEDLASKAPSLLLSSQADIQRVLSDATSGTTGAAKRVFYTERDCRDIVELFMAGLGELIFPGSVTMICMPFSGPHGLGELIAEAVTMLGARPLKLGLFRSYGEFKEIIKAESPDTFVGVPTQLLAILKYCGKGSLKRALVSGDACPDTVIEKCEAILGTKLFPHYGSREMGLGGAICCEAHEGMHLRENHVIAEIIGDNGEVLPDGEFGELVITTIGMEAMPLIRYKTGDFTRIIPGVCPCGSEVLRLDKLSRKGAASTMLRLDDALYSLDGLIDYAVKKSENGYSVNALTVGWDISPEIKELAEGILGEDVQVECCEADDNKFPLYKGKRVIL